MSIAKEFHFDILMTDVKAQTQPKIFETLAEEAAPLCDVDVDVLSNVLDRHSDDRTFYLSDGVAIFDVKSTCIKTPVMAMMKLDRGVAFNAMDGKCVDILASVLSPMSCGPIHLQRLANVSRILRSRDLCNALHDVESTDAMRALFMPTQDWMLAA